MYHIYTSVGQFNKKDGLFRTKSGKKTQAMQYRGFADGPADDPESHQKKIWEKQGLVVIYVKDPITEFTSVKFLDFVFFIVYEKTSAADVEKLFPTKLPKSISPPNIDSKEA